MPSLADDLIELPANWTLAQNVRVLERDETLAGRLLLKVRCQLPKGYQFQVWLHHEPMYQNYAYQLFTDRPILRWDNAPHFPKLTDNFPHHFHDADGTVFSSSLTGDALADLQTVMKEIEAFLTRP